MAANEDILGVTEFSPPSSTSEGRTSKVAPLPEAAARRLSGMVAREFDFVWRAARRLGLSPAASEDVAQEVFIVAARRLDDIVEGAERAFLYRTTTLVVSTARRTFARRRENLGDDAKVPDLESPEPTPESFVAAKQARALLDDVLAELDDDGREVFVLFEIEAMTTGGIAELLEIPEGTVKSRLRKARADFQSAIDRLRVREVFQGRRR